MMLNFISFDGLSLTGMISVSCGLLKSSLSLVAVAQQLSDCRTLILYCTEIQLQDIKRQAAKKVLLSIWLLSDSVPRIVQIRKVYVAPVVLTPGEHIKVSWWSWSRLGVEAHVSSISSILGSSLSKNREPCSELFLCLIWSTDERLMGSSSHRLLMPLLHGR